METEHLLFGVIADESSYASKVLDSFGVNKTSYSKIIKSVSKSGYATNVKPSLSKNVSLILSRVAESDANAQDILFLLLSKKEFKSYLIIHSVFGLDEKIILKKIEPQLGIYSKNKKCVYDTSSNYENAWQLVKMAEQKSIKIRKEKDLSIKQIHNLD